MGLEAMMVDHNREQAGYHLGTPQYADCRIPAGPTPTLPRCRLTINASRTGTGGSKTGTRAAAGSHSRVHINRLRVSARAAFDRVNISLAANFGGMLRLAESRD
jgi:hypothetical protein